jgi:segregation and condensation protein A
VAGATSPRLRRRRAAHNLGEVIAIASIAQAEAQRQQLTIEVAGFSGPLDLLLHLCERQKLDVTAVSLVAVTGQYLALLRAAEQIDHWALADFVAIGARLLELKSRALLPSPPQPVEEEAEPDPDDLVEMLRRYQQFKELAAYLRAREEEDAHAFTRTAPPPDVPPLPGLDGATPERLLAVLRRVLARTAPPPEPETYRRPRLTVAQKAAEILFELRISGAVLFSRVLERCRTREEIITSFFAVLDLVRAGRLDAQQDDRFAEIRLTPLVDASEAKLAGVEQA